MNICFIVNTSVSAGKGHLERSHLLAKKLREWQQNNVTILTSLCYKIPPKTDMIIVDHYGVDDKFMEDMHTQANTVLTLDYYANQSKTALVHPEFLKTREFYLPKITTGAQRVLISFGATDPKNLTGRLLKALEKNHDTNRIVDVLLAPEAPHLSAVEALVEKNINTRLRVGLPPVGVAYTVGEATIGIGECGTSAWERCCVGLPSIVVPTDGRQNKIAQILVENGCAFSVWEDRIETSIPALLTYFRDNPEEVKRMSDNCKKLVDGHGVDRLAEIIMWGHAAS